MCVKKYLILAIATAAAIGGIRLLPGLLTDPAVQVELIRVRKEEYAEHFSVSGTVESPSSRELIPDFPFVPGEVLVEEGDYVEYGQLIAVVDAEKTAKAIVSVAKEYADFLPEGFITPEVEDAIAQFGSETLSEQDEFPLELRAPMSGVLTSVNLQEGQLYLPTAPAAAVSSVSSLRLRLSVPEEQVGSLMLGQEFTFTVPAVEDGLFSARITRISPNAVQQLNGMNYQTVVEVVARIDDDFGVLRPGYSVQASLAAGEEETLSLLPYEAVLRDEDGSDYVYVVRDGAAVKRVVETGRQLSTAVEITEGLGRYEAVVWDAAALPGECAVRLAGEGEE